MSKSLKNYPDPMEIVNEHSADALRLYLINSPVVRAEPLAFKKDGVKDVVKDVLLPLWNAQKFFLQNHQRFLRDGHSFAPEIARNSRNVMDRWILAASNNLIVFVREEMKMYRLYTVVPKLLTFLDNLTNWYVRMNRRRLKGDGGHEDCGFALATLFTVLLTSVHLLSPFIPFLTETLYQRLKLLLPESERLDSVHYCMIPQQDSSLLDADIERKVERLQAVVAVGRVIRDKNGIPLKTPVRDLIILHSDKTYIDDIRELQAYVTEEVNCLSLQLTTETDKYVLFKAEPNLALLGKKLKGDAKKVGELIKALSPDAVKALMSTKSVEVGGYVLSDEEIHIVPDFKAGIENYQTHTEGESLLLVDIRSDENVVALSIAREFVNRVQRMRKKAGLTPGDQVRIFYKNIENDSVITAALASQQQSISETLKMPWSEIPCDLPLEEEFFREETDLRDKKLLLVFAK